MQGKPFDSMEFSEAVAGAKEVTLAAKGRFAYRLT